MNAQARTDIHRPSVIKPEDYRFVAIIFSGDGIDTAMMNMGEREQLRNDMARTGDKFSRHAHGGTCHICGAWAATVAYFHHEPSHSYIVTGQDCCEKIESGHADRFRAIRDEATAMKKAKAGKMKAQGLMKERDLEAVWTNYEKFDGLFTAQDAGWEEGVMYDITQKLINYGSLSDKQWDFLASLPAKVAKRQEVQAERDAENEAADPVPVSDKRMTVEGTVLAVKDEEGYYGVTTKMLVQHVTGWKVWGSVPSSLDTWDYEKDERGIAKGMRVKFDAKVEVSDDDPKFGFYKRPTKAEFIV